MTFFTTLVVLVVFGTECPGRLNPLLNNELSNLKVHNLISAFPTGSPVVGTGPVIIISIPSSIQGFH